MVNYRRSTGNALAIDSRTAIINALAILKAPRLDRRMENNRCCPWPHCKRVFGQLSNVPSIVTGTTGTPESMAR